MKWLNALASCAVVLLLCACGSLSFLGSSPSAAEGQAVPDASGKIQKTQGYVFLYNKNAPRQFVAPPIPAGAARLYGDLYSTYKNGDRNFTWKVQSLMPMDCKRDEAWFYVDFDPASGEILDAGAYATGYDRNVVHLGFFEKYQGSFGKITSNGFELQMAGVSYGGGVWQGYGEEWEYPAAIFVQGKANLLQKKNGSKVPFTYKIMDVAGAAGRISTDPDGNEQFEVTEVKKDELADKGKGTAILSK